MPRRQSPVEANLAVPADFVILARQWQNDAIDILLDFIWKGLDGLKAHGFTFDAEQENLEREITQLLVSEIRDVMSGDEWYYIEHGPFESETRQPAPAQPPQYDMGFLLRRNRRCIWPIEAKVIKTDGAVAEYVADIISAFLPAIYSPFSSQATMLGYLLRGSPNRTLERIASSLACPMERHPSFPDRDHGITQHIRPIPVGQPYPIDFTCHHCISNINE